MQGNIVSAVFDNYSEAERAVSELRAAGVGNDAISIIGRHEGETTETTGSGDRVDNDGDEPASFLSKAAAGSGIGALLGVAALAIPGVGPLAAAGAIAQSAIGGAALTGTAIGAAAGGLSDILTKHGVSDEDAGYYHERINNGGVFVSVDPDRANLSRDRAEDILFRAGGHNSSRSRAATTTY
ncbi:general stress protein [Sphingomonas arenae]|uniref:general stress protein n=1 Tax=Sphingomonas arenae TaxID=2812555 RepID=UPI001967428A|nr:general stress protein [Sphingomonas arenae]